MRALCFMLVASTLWGACRSPVEDDAIDALGDEVPGVPEGPFHRAGQPCLVCHDDYRGIEPKMAFGGTVYASATDKTPVEGATITIIDGAGTEQVVTSNCVGNFYMTAFDYPPVFPLNVTVQCPDDTLTQMNTVVGRDGSCAGCHEGPESATSPGWVRCSTSGPNPPAEANPACPVGPQ